MERDTSMVKRNTSIAEHDTRSSSIVERVWYYVYRLAVIVKFHDTRTDTTTTSIVEWY